MIRFDLIAIAVSVAITSCNGQTKSNNGAAGNPKSAPQATVKVDKKYDEKGNLIEYDSTYSYYYSNVQDNKTLRDSIFNDFKNSFNRKYFFSSNPYFNDLFFQDSLLEYDFYRNDFFINRFRDNMKMMESLFWSMDSLKNNFFKKQFTTPAPPMAPYHKLQ